MYIYILALEHNKYYVGRTIDVEQRWQQHAQGKGSAWTRLHSPLRIERVIESDSPFDEDRFTKEYMAAHGVDAVRGGTYVNVELSAAQRAAIQQELRMAADECVMCGKQGHFASECREFVRGADPSSYSFAYLLGNYFGLTRKKTAWCSVCNRAFTDDEGARKEHEKMCAEFYKHRCRRCARGGHSERQCYAKTNVYGERIS